MNTSVTDSNVTETDIKVNEIVNILLEIRDFLQVTSSSSASTSVGLINNLVSRLLEVSTPEETMNILVPVLLFPSSSFSNNHSTTNTREQQQLTSTDAIQILGFLVSSPTGNNKDLPLQYLIAASKVIKLQLQKYYSTSTTTNYASTGTTSIRFDLQLINVLIHQACTGLNVQVAQNCHDAIVLLFKIDSDESREVNHQPDTTTTSTTVTSVAPNTTTLNTILNGIVTIWNNSIAMIMDTSKEKAVRLENGTICVRCIELLVDIAILNDPTMQLVIDSNALSVLLSLMTNVSNDTIDDPLLLISIYDLLYKFASHRPMHPLRLQWLLNDTFIQLLLHKAGVSRNSQINSNGDDNNTYRDEEIEMDIYVGAPALRILLSICSSLCTTDNGTSSLLDDNHTGVTDNLIRNLFVALRQHDIKSSSEIERLLFIDAISSLASISLIATNLILNDPITCHKWFNLNVAQPKIKAAILVSIANVLDDDPHTNLVVNNTIDTDSNMNATSQSSNTTTKVSNDVFTTIFTSFGQINSTGPHSNTTELLLKLVQSPIPEIRFGTYRLLEAIAKYPTGGQILMTNTNFYTNFILSRDIETIYDGQILKYNIVQALYNNTTLQQLLSNEILKQFEQYIAQGPHYKKALQWDVMTAEQ